MKWEELKEKWSSRKKNKKQYIIPPLLVIVILSILILKYEWIISLLTPEEEHLELIDCEDNLIEWCSECFSINNENMEIWVNGGTKISKSLVKCSNDYFDTDWTTDQDCTGNTIDTCLLFILPE